MNELENAMFQAGFARDANVSTRWYRAWSGAKREPFPLEIRVTDAIWIVTSRYGKTTYDEIIPLLKFNGPLDLIEYLERNGQVQQPGPNVWD